MLLKYFNEMAFSIEKQIVVQNIYIKNVFPLKTL